MAKSTTENPAEGTSVPEDPTPVKELVKAGSTPVAVKYIGTADVREIDAAAWRNVGVEDQGKVVWDKRKFRGDRVPLDQLSAGAIEYCAQFDDGFALVDADGKLVG